MLDIQIQLQVAIQSKISTGGDITQIHTDFKYWHDRTRKHIVICDGGRFDPIATSATLTHYVAPWSDFVPIYDPIIFLDQYRDIDVSTSKVVYIYDLKVLDQLETYDLARFFSYMKHLLVVGVRVITAVPCGISRQDLDTHFKNKRVSDLIFGVFTNNKYFTALEV